MRYKKFKYRNKKYETPIFLTLRTKSSYLNAEDLNRMEFRCAELADMYRLIGYDVNIQTKYDWQMKDFLTEYHMSRIVANIRILMSKYSLVYPSSNYSVNIDYNDLNRLERILEIIYENILSIVRSWHLYSGTCIAGGSII